MHNRAASLRKFKARFGGLFYLRTSKNPRFFRCSEIQLYSGDAERDRKLIARGLAQAFARFLLRVGRLTHTEPVRDFGLCEPEVFAPCTRRRHVIDESAAHNVMRDQVVIACVLAM